MGIAERKKREKERRRNEIIDAAEQIFFSKGIQNATMDEVAEAAELSKGTLYLYFKSKSDLYLAINIRGLDILRKGFRQAAASAKTGLQQIFAIGRAYFQFAAEYPDYYAAMSYYEFFESDFENNSQYAKLCADYGHDVIGRVVETIQAGIEDGSIKASVDPVIMANLLWAQSSGVIQFAMEKRKHLEESHGVDIDLFISTFFDMIACSLDAESVS